MNKKTVLAAVAVCLTASVQAWAGTFTFTVVDDPQISGSKSVSGTITGRIFGLLDDGANQTATSIIIDSAPVVYIGLVGVDVVNDAGWTHQGLFATVNGQILHANFGADHNSPLPIFSFTLNTHLSGDNGGLSGLLMNDGDFLRATQELDATYGSSTSATPEPSTVTMFGMALAGLGVGVRRRKK